MHAITWDGSLANSPAGQTQISQTRTHVHICTFCNREFAYTNSHVYASEIILRAPLPSRLSRRCVTRTVLINVRLCRCSPRWPWLNVAYLSTWGCQAGHVCLRTLGNLYVRAKWLVAAWGDVLVERAVYPGVSRGQYTWNKLDRGGRWTVIAICHGCRESRGNTLLRSIY